MEVLTRPDMYPRREEEGTMPRGQVHVDDPKTTGHAMAAILERAAAAVAADPERYLAADGAVLASPFDPPLSPGTDIMALAFLVMMAAAQSAQEDLRRIMDEVKEAIDEKRRWRAVQKSLAACAREPHAAGAAAIDRADLDATLAQAKRRLDSISELGEMESLRLQMAMDRMSKLMSTLSNLLKKTSDTAQSITQNLK